MTETKEAFESWCVVELLGHVRMAGRVTEEERFGCKMGRIDIPKVTPCDCPNASRTDAMGETIPCSRCLGCGSIATYFTQYFSGSSVYRLTPCTEEAARAVAARNVPEPVHAQELPKPVTVVHDRTMKCGHTPENCDCEPTDDDFDEDDE
jgi:hypothetical protein